MKEQGQREGSLGRGACCQARRPEFKPQTQMMGEENRADSPKVSSDLHMHPHTYAHAQIHVKLQAHCRSFCGWMFVEQ